MNLLCLVGPTGVGKTAVAIELCALLNGEIVSADSMQIYRGLDIATAKPTPEEQRRARHHLIDIREPDQPCSAAQWADEARAAIHQIRRRDRLPIVAGGTGFYLRALLTPGVLASTPPDPALRTALEAEAQEHGAAWMHAKLERHDPTAAARLHPNDVYRVIRALEVAHAASPLAKEAPGKEAAAPPFPAGQASAPAEAWPAAVYGLTMPREALYARLDARIDAMLGAGFRRELAFAARFAPALPSMMGVGYRQMRPALADAALWDAGVDLWKRDTRRYAKRQMTWFRHQLPTDWLDVTDFPSPAAIASEIVRRYQEQPQ